MQRAGVGRRFLNMNPTGGTVAETVVQTIDELPNLLGWWRADTEIYQDEAKTTPSSTLVYAWNDQSGNALHLTKGTAAGATYLTTGGPARAKFGALQGEDYLGAISKTTEFSIVMTAKPASIVNYSRHGGRRNGTTKGFNVITYGSAWGINLFSPRNTSEIIVRGSTTLTVGNTYHVIITYDGAGDASGVTHIYVDGNDETLTTEADTLGANDITDASGLFEVGSSGFAEISEWAICNYIITAEEAANLYSAAQTDWGI